MNSLGSADVSLVYKLTGHTSFITHLDWSADGKLLRSTCGAFLFL